MQVAILGCGPAGLLAAKAASNAGHTPVIFSRKVKSKISGAQYLARPIHNLTERTVGFQVKFDKRGTGENYTARLYQGHEVPVRSSWHNFENGKLEAAWSMEECYELLWAEFVDSIVDMEVSKTLVDGLLHRGADMVVSSIPRWVLEGWTPEQFRDPATGAVAIFQHRKVWIAPGERLRCDDNTIVYNGRDDGSSCYRWSKIRGVASAEFTSFVPGAIEIIKPIAYCGTDPYPSVVKVGRYGAWSKMQLAHHAYSSVLERLRPDVSPQLPGVQADEV